MKRNGSSLTIHQTRDSIADVWGERTPHFGDWPNRVDERRLETPTQWVQSTCVLCSTGCGLDIGVREGRIVGVRGRVQDRVNHGRLGPKGLHGWEANQSPDRLRQPLVRHKGRLVAATWDEALNVVVERTRDIVAKHTSGAIGFYNSGQLFLEEYYTLSCIGDAGLGTPHLDGNTRLCTATAAAALIESFGTDGDPGSYTDLDLTEALFLVGHNPAMTQTVLWMRILDRLAGPRRPRLVVVDPRRTTTARAADVHLAPVPGTNVALLNGLLHLVIRAGHIDRGFIDAHTEGFENLVQATAKWTPERTAGITQVSAAQLEAAAEILGQAPSLVSTVLQGVYQSNQATAAAVQVNNLNLIRGMIGKPGCAVFQMNGQPTAQNTRECGANGELIAFLNYANPEHVRRVARHWNVDPARLPHGSPPTHCMQIFRYAEEGSIRMLWILGTNPAVTLPELGRIHSILEKDDLFVVVNDAFPNETTMRADVVLPAALWGEKTGTFTNADRTVHIAYKAIEPPGEARSDLDILLDYARRMDFRDQDGAPLPRWHDPQSAFDDFKQLTRGRPCDYSGLTYEKLTGGSGVQWPCNAEHPDGTERLYTDGVFNTGADTCETYGHDLETGAAVEPAEYRLHDPAGRARIKSADYIPPVEVPDKAYPFWLTTGRLVYHWHTRTKTARCPELQAAAPDVFVQIAAADAAAYAIRDGDMVEVESRRGRLRARAMIDDIRPGLLFVPFHYGAWDGSERRAANQLTITDWDPVSKQPHFKFAAVRVRKVKEASDGRAR